MWGKSPDEIRPARTSMNMPVILTSFSSRARYYLDFYQEFAVETWEKMTPMQYGTLLIGIGVFGWLLMKTSFK